MKILADQQIPFAKEAFQQFGDVTLVHGREITHDNIKNTDILLLRSITQVNKALLEGTPVQFVGTATSGFDHIDQDYLQDKGIAYAYAPGSNARSVAEYILSALFILQEMQGDSLKDKTAGIIGYGHVGSRLARFLQTIGIKCVINDPPLEENSDSDMFVALEEVLKADIISLHVPLTLAGEHATKNLIGADELDQLKEGATLINTARGGVVDESALLEHIERKPLKTIIDVWENEPDINSDLLQKVHLATPHIAGYSTDGKLRATDMLYQFACNVFEEKPVWQMEKVFSESDRIAVAITDTDNFLETVETLVLSSYDVRGDCAALRNLSGQEQQSRGDYFDSLRKDYPIRREFNHMLLQSEKVSDDLKKAVETLGFHMELNQ